MRLVPSNPIRLACDEGLSPSPPSMIPASTSSSLYLPIASSRSDVGRVPASLSAVALTKTTTLMVLLLGFSTPHQAHARTTNSPGRFRQDNSALSRHAGKSPI